MVNLDNVTLVSVTSVNVERAIKTLRYSMRNVSFKDVKLFTDVDVNCDDINVVKIEKLDYINYSRFIVYDLHKHIDTEFVLIIQDDGFIVNSDKWQDIFLEYDYIGAPFRIPPINDKVSYRDPFGNLCRVGNGGFSLRSKKILELPSKLNLEWKSYFGYYNEDGFFAVHNKHILENHGCVYAPIDIAANFSIEYNVPEHDGVTTFGFHGKHNKYYNLI
jgi:hypothetical protein